MPEEKNQNQVASQPIDVINQYTGEKWYYTDIVKEHFFNPKNLMLEDPDETQYQAVGMVGSPACGDMLKMWMKVDPETERIKELKWRTFGCLSAGQLVYAPGGLRPIESFEMGEKIFAGDGKTWEVLEPSRRPYSVSYTHLTLPTTPYV